MSIVPETITVLKSQLHDINIKRFRLENGNLASLPVKLPLLFNAEEHAVSSLSDLSSLLITLEHDPSRFIIRGKLIEGRQKENIRRTGKSHLFDDPNSNFNPAPRQWCMIDIDDLELPTEYADIDASKPDILAYTTAKLPEAFRGVDCHYQFSASMGVKKDKVRVHLWYWLNRRVSDAEMKAWMGQSDVPVDMTLFRPVQPHFTANPIFENGAINPLPNRSGVYDAHNGQDTVTVPENLNEFLTAQTRSQKPRHTRSDGYLEAQEIIRDQATGLAIDGREKLLYWLSLTVMNEWVKQAKGKEKPSLDEITNQLWEEFSAEADLTDGKWSIAHAKSKATARITELETGQFTFSSRSDNTTLYPVESPYFHLDAVDKQTGMRQLNESLAAFFRDVEEGKTPRKALRITMGAGKTSQTIHHLKTYLKTAFATNVEIYVPRHDIADEYERRLHDGEPASANVVHMYGRGGIDLQIPPLCKRYDYVQQLENAGVSVYQNACYASRDEVCVHFNDCAYLSQYHVGDEIQQLQNTIRIFQHASLALPRNRLESTPDIVIVDEAFLGSCLKKQSFPAELVRTHFTHPAYQHLGSLIVDCLREGKPLLTALRDEGIDANILNEVTFDHLLPTVRFDGSTVQQRRITSGLLYRFLMKMRSVISEELRLDSREVATRILYDVRKGEVVLTHLDDMRIPDTAALLVLDATADELLLEKAVGDIQLDRIDIWQNAVVTQVYDRTGSNTWWNKNTDEIASLVQVMNAWASFGEKVLCVSHKQLADELRQSETLHDSVKVNHFGNIRGSNDAEDCDIIFITGRNQPPPSEVDIAARALFWDDETPLQIDEGGRIDIADNKATNLPLELRGYTFDGNTGVNVRSFSDPRTERWHQQIREAETIQAIARLRLVHSPFAKRVMLLGNLPIEMPINTIVAFADLMPDKLELELLKKGNLPLSQLGFTVMRPDLAKTDKQAEKLLARSKFKKPSDLTLAKFGRIFPDLHNAVMCIVTFKATHNGRTREHRHLFMVPTPAREQVMPVTTGALPIDDWTRYLEQGDEQLGGSGWGNIELRGIDYVPASLLPQ